MISPGLHRLPVPVPGQLDPLEPGGVVLDGVELLGPNGGALKVDHVVVAVVADLDLLETQLVEDPVPGLLGDEGGGVHDAPVGDNEHVLSAFLCHRKVRVLKSHHRADKMFLKIQNLLIKDVNAKALVNCVNDFIMGLKLIKLRNVIMTWSALPVFPAMIFNENIDQTSYLHFLHCLC